jgi:hypothetical protein
LAERIDAFLSIVVYHDILGDRRYYRDHNHCYLVDEVEQMQYVNYKSRKTF